MKQLSIQYNKDNTERNMRYLILILLSLFMLGLCSCGNKNFNEQRFAKEDMKSIYEEFVADAKARGAHIDTDDLTVVLGDPGAEAYGHCERTIKETMDESGYNKHIEKVIILDTNYWENAPEIGKKVLMYHELGHCLMNQKHRDSENMGLINSIMNPRSAPVGEFHFQHDEKMWNSLVDELFSYN